MTAPTPARALLRLPRIVAGRDYATALAADALGDVTDTAVFVDATALRFGSGSFADELVDYVLVRGGARSMTLVLAPVPFTLLCAQAAARGGVDALLGIGTCEELPRL